MDGASACVFLCGLSQSCFLHCIFKDVLRFVVLKLNYETLCMESKSARLQLIPTLGKVKAKVQELDSFALTTTDLAVYHWLPVFSPFLLVASGCLDEKLSIIAFPNGPPLCQRPICSM